MKDQGRIDLNQRGPGPDLGIGIGSGGTAATANERNTSLGQTIKPPQAVGGWVRQGRTGKAAGLRLVRAFQPRRTFDRGVADDQTIDAHRERYVGDVVQFARYEVWPDLDQERRWLLRVRRGAVAGDQRTPQQILDGPARLQSAQPRRVRRRDVEDKIIGKASHHLDSGHIVGRAIRRVAVLADIGADAAGRVAPCPAFGEPLYEGRNAAAVEAQAVDDRFVLIKPKQTRLRIARLWLWGHRAPFHKAQAQRQHLLDHPGDLL